MNVHDSAGPDRDDPLSEWKRSIVAGNRFDERGDLPRARAAYLAALALAESGLERGHRTDALLPDADAVVAAFVIAHHNLADLCLRSDEPERAMDHLRSAHARLVRLCHGEGLPQALVQAALRQSHRTRIELMQVARVLGTASTTLWTHTGSLH